MESENPPMGSGFEHFASQLAILGHTALLVEVSHKVWIEDYSTVYGFLCLLLPGLLPYEQPQQNTPTASPISPTLIG